MTTGRSIVSSASGSPPAAFPLPAVPSAPLRVGSSREVRPELLDGMNQDSPAAQASRRDLRRINQLMGNAAWFGRELRQRRRVFEDILEVGAGTGELGRALNARGFTVAGLDLCRRPHDWPRSARWFQTDVHAFAGWGEFTVVIGNLFFHHFEPEELARLGEQLARHARVIVASEPVRRPHAWRLFAVVGWLLRFHPVTHHDGRVSIGAGFRGDELPRLLRLDPAVWTWQVRETWRGASRLVAERRR